MIELRGLTKFYKTKNGRHYVYRNVNVIFPEGKNIGVIGPNGAGKSTLLRLIGKIEYPNEGKIITNKRISFPVGFQGGFQGSLTGRELAKFVMNVYLTDEEECKEKIKWIYEFTELGRYFDMPVKTYSTGMRARLAFGISMALDFDYYLLDEVTAVGDAEFKRKSHHILQEKLTKGANIILASHSLELVKKFCDLIVIPYKGDIILFTNFKEVEEFYQKVCFEGPIFRENGDRT
ncbi:MAG: ABC transporter ATP-binding protein [Elusimicrobiota bacterium]|nr:ABC transporter ATP-binding protein [Endomicrobiia bacterium]MDW7998795.1 ABC transporter ATP-binding protein [Thermodesulfovibrio sp.]MDW8165892.1 ABC transporter ATP-binding protein [Elusimicrobiota bacterium]